MRERFEVFTVLINRINRNIRKIKNQEMVEHNLKSAHISCLYYLYMNKGSTATELCECSEEDKATISRALEYLETNEYITRESKSEKRYRSPLILTKKGKEIGKKIAEKIDGVLEIINTHLTESDRAHFYRCLSIISDNLDMVSKKGKSKELV